jgi:hypothetical protein
MKFGRVGWGRDGGARFLLFGDFNVHMFLKYAGVGGQLSYQ